MNIEKKEENNQILMDIDIAQLESFRKQFNINEERFNGALEYVRLVLDGENKSKAYASAFNVELTKARTLASQFHKSKWVQELVLFLRPDENTLYFGEVKRVIQAGMAIIDDQNASNRDKTEAMKALQPYIKAQKEKELDEKEIVASVGETISDNITKKIEELAAQGKMIDDNGNIIDVTVIN